MDCTLDLFGFPMKKETGYHVLQSRLDNYKKDWCYQYEMRKELEDEDLFYSGLTKSEVGNLRVNDFVFKHVVDENEKKSCVAFIERHEWLGTIAPFTTHWFVAKYKNLIGGVILLSEPYNRQRFFNDEKYDDCERLISRGACVSWSPKNLASAFLMFILRYMVKNTKYRIFTAYSDPSAKELGTIYQACNFYYLGNNFGKTTRFRHPFIPNKIVNSRAFRDVSMYRYAANQLGIQWFDDWSEGNVMFWNKIPVEMERKLRDKTIEIEHSSERIDFPSKHKYAYVLGNSKSETKRLRTLFLSNNKTYEYPKERGM